MLDYQNIKISDYDYHLPDNQIARHPLSNRDDSKLLIYNYAENHSLIDEKFQNIDQFLPENSLLILNNTQVIQARILLQKETGAQIEIFLLEPFLFPDFSHVLFQTEKIQVKCLVGNAKKWKNETLNKLYKINDQEIILSANISDRTPDYFVVELSWTPHEIPFYQILDVAGAIPLPPYLGRDAEESDKDRYQTIFSAIKGSVAAPTAGLHFTTRIFEKLAIKNIHPTYLTLHVGAGTFKPVKSELIEEHQMHFESISVDRTTIEHLLENESKKYILVGTTSVRTMESLYWIAMKLKYSEKQNFDRFQIQQWEAYQYLSSQLINRKQALEVILEWMIKTGTEKLTGATQMMIVPGYSFKMTNVLITNFHQPCSTLLLLVSAFTNQNWGQVYQHALASDYRFLSYGDSCLLFPQS